MKQLEELMPATTVAGLFKILARLAFWLLLFSAILAVGYGIARRGFSTALQFYSETWLSWVVAYVCLVFAYAVLFWIRNAKK